MRKVVAVCATRAGQGSTHWATSLAWTLAEERSVLLVDADMEGGTVADLLYLRTDERGLANCFGDRAASAEQLESQALIVPGRDRLRVIPGLKGTFGFEITECLRRIGPAMRTASADVVIADLGHPLAHPGLRSPRAAAEAISACFHRVFVVVRDDPALIMRSIDVLRSAQLSHGEVVVCQQRSRAHQQLLRETFAREVPDLPVREGWSWDERRAMRMGESGRPALLPAAEAELAL